MAMAAASFSIFIFNTSALGEELLQAFLDLDDRRTLFGQR
jgi:hypothetical protein